MRFVAAAVSCALFFAPGARALAQATGSSALRDPPPLDAQAVLADAQRLEAELRWQGGSIALGEGLATLELGDAYRFLGADDAARVLVEAWQSPVPQPAPLGMVFAAGVGPFTPGGFAALVEWAEDGHVSDAGAAQLDADALLAAAQAAVAARNAERSARGQAPIRLLGWAAPPSYDPERHALVLAHELALGDGGARALDYDAHLLARRGVLTLRAVATPAELLAVRAHMDELVRRVAFAPGHRYTDFDSGADDVAAYGFTGLLAGGLLAKAGFWKLTLGALLASKKWLVLAALGLAALLARQLARRRVERV